MGSLAAPAAPTSSTACLGAFSALTYDELAKMCESIKAELGASIAKKAAEDADPQNVKPTHISELTGMSYDEIKARFGGKAAGLWRLRHQCDETHPYTLGDVWFYPCGASLIEGAKPRNIKKPPLQEWNLAIDNKRFAVRSGAPVSMPGLLETKLNVAWEDIPAAVEAVWASWNSEHAKAYRSTNNIPDDLGTGCIVMPMVNALRAGVAFTAALDGSDPDTFELTAEYVEGLGDKLVGGEAAKKFSSWVSPAWTTLQHLAKSLHDHFGASDIEWAEGVDGSFWILQWRLQKFPPPKPIDLTPAPDGRVILATGEPIGAPVMTAGNALYVPAFKPERYPEMLKCSAIITMEGGATCHAAIVARERGIPAVRARLPKSVQSMAKDLWVDGRTGEIFIVNGTAEKFKAEAIAPKMLEVKRPQNVDPTLFTAEERNNYLIDGLLLRFYHAFTLEESEKLRRHEEIAHILGSYGYLICLGEARHMWNHWRVEPSRFAKEFRTIGIHFPETHLDRTSQLAAIPVPESIDVAIRAMELAVELFKMPGWGSSYGGESWAEIAETVLWYLTGKLTPTLFGDSIWNKKHNGGLAFDKVPNLTMRGHGDLMAMLDQRRHMDLEAFVTRWKTAATTLVRWLKSEIPQDMTSYPAVAPKHEEDDDDEDSDEEKEDGEEVEECHCVHCEAAKAAVASSSHEPWDVERPKWGVDVEKRG